MSAFNAVLWATILGFFLINAAAVQDFPVRALARQELGLKQYCIGTADRRDL